jgi:hypothetical protein
MHVKPREEDSVKGHKETLGEDKERETSLDDLV